MECHLGEEVGRIPIYRLFLSEGELWERSRLKL